MHCIRLLLLFCCSYYGISYSKSIDETLWQPGRNAKIDKQRTEAFTALLKEYLFYYRLLQLEERSKTHKKLFNDIKSRCKACPDVTYYMWRGNKVYKQTGFVLNNPKVLDKKECQVLLQIAQAYIDHFNLVYENIYKDLMAEETVYIHANNQKEKN